MRRFFRWYFGTSLILRIFVCFVAGAVIGGVLWGASARRGTPAEPVAATTAARPATAAAADEPRGLAEGVIAVASPFGALFVRMLKMVVIPVIFFSLVVGAASLPIRRFGRVGLKTLGWYLGCSVLAAVIGVCLALAISPGSTRKDQWQTLAQARAGEAEKIAGQEKETTTGGVLKRRLLDLFQNPFEALAKGNFLPIIVFAILFGLAVRATIEGSGDERVAQGCEALIAFLRACQQAMFKLVEWILEYAPVGVLALTIENFGTFGPRLLGPYVSVTLGVVLGITVMVAGVYPMLLWVVTRRNPFRVLARIRKAMITAFVTRSSAATLPVSIETAEDELKIHNELASFSLPLGATINMDGVCVHLPMFAVLAANMFGLELTAGGLAIMVLTTVLSSIGAGGVPGGSLFLLFVILQAMGLGGEQVAVIVALALGINPILDMFETMNNITGDLVCTYAVAHNEGLIGGEPGEGFIAAKETHDG